MIKKEQRTWDEAKEERRGEDAGKTEMGQRKSNNLSDFNLSKVKAVLYVIMCKKIRLGQVEELGRQA